MARPQREIPWLDQRDGVYYVCWYDTGKGRTGRLSLRTRDATEAQNRYISFLTEGRSLLRRTPGAGLTVAEALDQYLAEHECEAKWRQATAAEHLKGFWGNTPLSVIGIPESRRYTAWRAEAARPAVPSTVRRELVVLVAAVNHAVRWKRLPKDHAPIVELPTHAPQQVAHFLNRAELRCLLDHAALSIEADPRLYAFAVLAYLAGARRKSIERLRAEQVDLERRRIKLTPEGKRTTKKRAPVVPINDEMASAIGRLKLWSPDKRYLFGSPGFDVYKRFKAACLATGIEGDRAHPHVLRHSRATHMLQDGVSLFDVAKLLGDTVETVERVYGHHCPEYMSSTGSFRPLGRMLDGG